MNYLEKFYLRRKEIAKLTTQGYSLTQIAQKYKISKNAVSLLIKKAIRDGEIIHLLKNKTTTQLYENFENVILLSKPKNTKQCVICNNIINKNTKTCSKTCYIKLRRKGGKWSRYEFVELTCSFCKNKFKRSKYHFSINNIKKKTNKETNYYCSRECYCLSWKK